MTKQDYINALQEEKDKLDIVDVIDRTARSTFTFAITLAKLIDEPQELSVVIKALTAKVDVMAEKLAEYQMFEQRLISNSLQKEIADAADNEE